MSLKENGFLIVRNFYDVKNHTEKISDLFEYIKEVSKKEATFDQQSPYAPSLYNQTEFNKVQIKLMSKIEKETNLKLYPTYNYSRIYNKKSILEPHIDRPACEISITMNVGYEGDYNWPIWIKDNHGKNHEVFLEPGDALIYKGCENYHWREPADDRVKCQLQVFLHYVDQDGPYSDAIFDKIRYG